MNWYAHIDHTDTPNKYVVRVTELKPIAVTNPESGEPTTRYINGAELLRFEVTTELAGQRLRRHVEKLAAERMP